MFTKQFMFAGFCCVAFAGACFLSSDAHAQSKGKQGPSNPKSGTGSGNPKSGTGKGNPGGNPNNPGGNPNNPNNPNNPGGNPNNPGPGGNPLPSFPAPPVAKKKIGKDYQAQMAKNVETALFNKFLTDSLTNAAIRPNPFASP